MFDLAATLVVCRDSNESVLRLFFHVDFLQRENRDQLRLRATEIPISVVELEDGGDRDLALVTRAKFKFDNFLVCFHKGYAVGEQAARLRIPGDADQTHAAIGENRHSDIDLLI